MPRFISSTVTYSDVSFSADGRGLGAIQDSTSSGSCSDFTDPLN